MADRTSIVAATALGAATLALCAPPSSGQQPAAGAIGEAHLLPAGEWEWAIGRWEGTLLMSAGFNNPTTLLIDKDSGGRVTCRLIIVPPPSDPPSSAMPSDAGLTKRCVIGRNGISLTTGFLGDLELSRSGTDGLQGASKLPYGRGAQAPRLAGIQLSLTKAR